MALSPTGPLERAAAAARAEEPDDWESVSSSVKRRVRAPTVTPSRPVVVVGPDGATEQDEAVLATVRLPFLAAAARGAGDQCRVDAGAHRPDHR